MEFRVQGSGFKLKGLGFRGLECMVLDFVYRTSGLGFRVEGFGPEPSAGLSETSLVVASAPVAAANDSGYVFVCGFSE